MVNAENINHQSFFKNIAKNRRTILAGFEYFFSPNIRQAEQENVEFLKRPWVGTGIIERLETIRDKCHLIYGYKEDKNKYLRPELMHINYEDNKITTISDYYGYKSNTFGNFEKFKQMTIEIIYPEIEGIKTREKMFKMNYTDLRHENNNFEITSKYPNEILKKIDVVFMQRDKTRKVISCLRQTI